MRRFIPRSRKGKIFAAVGVVFAIFVIIGALTPNPSAKTAASNAKPAASSSSSPTTAPTSTARPTTKPKPSQVPIYPPRNMKAFLAFAATGDVSQVRQVGFANEGLSSCPEPNYYVAIPRSLGARVTEADLSAFFVEKGLTANRCQAFVFAFYSYSDYKANTDNGYTAGRVAITTNSPGPPWNLEVDAGGIVTTQEMDSQQSFNFNF